MSIHSRVFIISRRKIKQDKLHDIRMNINHILNAKLGIKYMTNSNKSEDIKWLSMWYKGVVDDDTIDMHKLREGIKDEIQNLTVKYRECINDTVYLSCYIYEHAQYSFIFAIVDESGIHVMTTPSIIADYTKYLLHSDDNVVAWDKEELRYKIIDTLDYIID